MAATSDQSSRTLGACLQIAFLVTLLICLGAILSASSLLSALAVFPAFALTLFPVSNFVLILWILLKPEVRAVLSGRRRLNTTSFANTPLIEEPVAADLELDITVHLPVHTENFAIIRDTVARAQVAVAAYNARAAGTANLIVSDDALMIWAGNELSECLAAAEDSPDAQLSDERRRMLERVRYYRDHGVAFVARPAPVPGLIVTERKGRFKKAGNLNRTLQLADAVAFLRDAKALSADAALAEVLQEERFLRTYAEGHIAVGELILMLDKDSLTPPEALLQTAPEFARDESLAYTQHKTVASNDGENYFAGIMGVFTRLVFGLVFPAKALQGWMPPFMGHNGFVRKSVLAAGGYWSEDRVGEDLDFTLHATAAGYRGKFIAMEGSTFGEQVTRTYAEEASKYCRYGFSILELILNPPSQWLSQGLFTERFVHYMRSGALAWEHKLDLMVVYPFFYINLALIPLMTVLVPYVGVNVLIYGLIFFLSLAPPLLLASQQEEARGISVGRKLFQFQALGFLFVSFGVSILRGFLAFFFAPARLHFSVTSVDGLDHGVSLADLLRQLARPLQAAALLMLMVGLSFSWAQALGLLTVTHIAAACPVLVAVVLFPPLMSPVVMRRVGRLLRQDRGPPNVSARSASGTAVRDSG